MSFTTAAVLVYIVATTPVAHLRFIDKFHDTPTCEAVVEAVKRQEVLEPPEERIGGRLQCILLSLKNDQDDDGPSKPVIVPPTSFNSPVTGHPCRHPISGVVVPCKEASYKQ